MTIPRAPEPYRFDPKFERIFVTLSCSRARFYARVGYEIDPELLTSDVSKLAMRAARAIALNNGAGPSSAVLVLQRLRRWMADGKVTFEQINELNDYFDKTIDEGLPDEESVITELTPIIQQRIRDEAVRAGIDSFSKKGDLSKLVALETRASRVGAATPTVATVTLTPLSEVSAEPVRWLWQRRIALGSLTLLDGDPGLGKSTLTTDLAARCSAGLPMPFDGLPPRPADVVILSAEDHAAHTIKPRVEAAGGDPARVHVLTGVPDGAGGERLPCLPDDLDVLLPAFERLKVRLLVIDPLFAFLSGRVDSHRDQDVKRALTMLAKLAERLDIALVAVRHLNKTNNDRALYRGGGSIGIVGAARSALLVGRDPNDDSVRVLAPVKNNLSTFAPSLRFRIVSEVVVPGDDPIEAGRIEWMDECEYGADDLVASPPREKDGALAHACEFLLAFLAGGPKDAEAVIEAAAAADISKRTVERAKVKLGIESTKGSGTHAPWQWGLLQAGDRRAAVVVDRGAVGEVGGLLLETDEPLRGLAGSRPVVGVTPPTTPS